MADDARIDAELWSLIEEDPGNDAFVELAERMSTNAETRPRARELCFQGLSHNPGNARGRLLLAKLFYLDRMPEFCVRELLEVRKLADTPAVRKLLLGFGVQLEQSVPEGAGAPPAAPEAVVSELDLEEDFVEALEEMEQ